MNAPGRGSINTAISSTAGLAPAHYSVRGCKFSFEKRKWLTKKRRCVIFFSIASGLALQEQENLNLQGRGLSGAETRQHGKWSRKHRLTPVVIATFKRIWQSLFYRQWAIICFESNFFETEEYNCFHYHNLLGDELLQNVSKLSQEGILFCVNQRIRHQYILEDCPECLGLLNHSLRGTIAKEYPRVWAKATPNLISTLREYVVQGERLRISEEGGKILHDAGTRFLGFSPLQEASYLAMYNLALKLGFKNQERHDFAYVRANVLSQFLSLDQFPTASPWQLYAAH